MICKIDLFCKNCNNILIKRQIKFCNQKCQMEFTQKEYIIKWKNGKVTGGSISSTSDYIRNYLFEKFGNKCCKCSWSEINKFSNRIPLEVDHIDGNWWNNDEENLCLLCPNCHSLTRNFRALNKGNGRHSILKKRNRVTFGN